MLKLHPIIKRYLRPTDGDGESGGAATVTDRGDDWTPTPDDEAPPVKVAPKAAKEEPVKKDETEEPSEKSAEELEAEIAAAEAAKVETEAAAAEAAKTKPKDTRVPLARHKEILDKERLARETVEAELAKYKQADKIADTNTKLTAAEDKLVSMEAEYAKLISDGELKEAAAKVAEIRRLERSINDQRAESREQVAMARAVETVRYDTTVERIEAAYPLLNEDHTDYDATKMASVMELKSAYQALGHPPSIALQKAVKMVMPAPETTRQAAAVESEARVDKVDVAKQVAKDRKEAAVAKNVDTSAKQPPLTTKVGIDSDKTGGGAIDAKKIMQLSHKDFSALDEATLSKNRGDEL